MLGIFSLYNCQLCGLEVRHTCHEHVQPCGWKRDRYDRSFSNWDEVKIVIYNLGDDGVTVRRLLDSLEFLPIRSAFLWQDTTRISQACSFGPGVALHLPFRKE